MKPHWVLIVLWISGSAACAMRDVGDQLLAPLHDMTAVGGAVALFDREHGRLPGDLAELATFSQERPQLSFEAHRYKSIEAERGTGGRAHVSFRTIDGGTGTINVEDASKAPATQPATRPAMEFETYQLVILRSVEGAPPIEREQATEIQQQHIAHLRKLGEAGKILVAGPFGDQQDKTFRGMCIYRVGSIDEARELAEADPAVQAGRLRVEVMTWYVEKGYMAFPKAP